MRRAPRVVLRHGSVFDDRLLFYRERGAGVYGSFPYWISSNLPYIPQCIAASVTYSTIVYFLTGLHPGLGGSRWRLSRCSGQLDAS